MPPKPNSLVIQKLKTSFIGDASAHGAPHQIPGEQSRSWTSRGSQPGPSEEGSALPGLSAPSEDHTCPPAASPVHVPKVSALSFCQLLHPGKHLSCATPHIESANQNLGALFGTVLSALADGQNPGGGQRSHGLEKEHWGPPPALSWGKSFGLSRPPFLHYVK